MATTNPYMEVRMNTAIIIPARHASSRLPGKPLLRETGKYLIQHVYESASEARRATRVVVATDDSRIVAAVRSFGGQVCRTRRDHASGTDRVAEVARTLDADLIINLQGDEPLVDPASLDLLADLLQHDTEAQMATLAVPIRSVEQWRNPNCVKVVCDRAGRALYFSRSPIPYVREGGPNLQAEPPLFLQHLGLYAYRRPYLLELASRLQEPLEQAERLEQLRVLSLGQRIQVGIVRHAAIGVDTYDDYRRFVAAYRERSPRRAA
jgi:3-deoxy-manno-octulosonate cytidylyltransferase (CMP-KDO synthetase)